MSFFEKSLNTLELPAVLTMLAAEAVSEPAKELALKLTPSIEEGEVRHRLSETTAAKSMMVVRGSPSFYGVKDVRSSLARADLGGSLNTRELLEIAHVLQCARLVRGYLSDDTVGKTPIDYLFYALHANRFLEEKITSSITGEDEIADAASSDLANIRRQMRAAAARARDALQKIISSPSYAKVLQEPIITQRSDRYVVPVKAEHKGAINGLVHDISASGATIFVEPMAAVKANNELRELAARLIAGGYQEDTPAAIIYKATWPEEEYYCCTVSTLADTAEAHGIKKTALVLVGDVIAGSGYEKSRLYDKTFSTEFRTARQE